LTTAPSTKRSVGIGAATALVVGHTIGVGVFLTPAAMIGAVGSPVLILIIWVVCGAAAFAGALAFGELAGRFPQAGGPYIYLRQAFGPEIAFLYGWQSLLVMDPGVTAALAAGVREYLVAAWPSAALGQWSVVSFIWALAALNVAGVKLTTRVLAGLTAVKVAALLLVITLAFTAESGSWSPILPVFGRTASASSLPEALAVALVAAFFSFGGFWEASRIAGEVLNPNHVLPRALALGVAIITSIYVATTLAFLYVVPASAADPIDFTRRAGVALAGSSIGPRLLAAVVLASVLASLGALMMMAPRLYVAMSRAGVLPRGLGSTRAQDDSSIAATVLLAALATLYTVLGSFQQIVAFFFCTALGFVALSVGAIFVLRRGSHADIGFRCPGYPWLPLAFIALLAVVIALVALARPVQALSGVGVVALGIPVYRVLRVRGAVAPSVPQGVES
jgi:APA family basic amino acid/polyamine antiporter